MLCTTGKACDFACMYRKTIRGEHDVGIHVGLNGLRLENRLLCLAAQQDISCLMYSYQLKVCVSVLLLSSRKQIFITCLDPLLGICILLHAKGGFQYQQDKYLFHRTVPGFTTKWSREISQL